MRHHLIFALSMSLGIQAVFFAFAAALKTDKVTDLSYGLTFVLMAAAALVQSDRSVPAVVLAAMVIAWGVRLAGYLLFRIIHMGRDARFDGIREHFWAFFKFWLLQGVAAWVIMLPVTLWFAEPRGYTPWLSLGGTIWLIGFAIETIADHQKLLFKRTVDGRSRWTDTGLWRYSRHPNYFGEMLCWWGLFVCTAPALGAWTMLGAAGPVAITALLLFVTGIPPLEAAARKRWGDNPDYQAYRRRTRTLLPWPRS